MTGITTRPARAQTPAELNRDVRTDLGSALRVVRPLVRDDPARAAGMLRKLRAEYPGHTRIYILLGETYQVMGLVDSAKVAYETCLRLQPTNLRAGASLGVLYIRSGDRGGGDTVFRNLLDGTDHSVNTYRTIGNTLSRHGFYDLAMVMYRDGRERNEDNYVLTLDIAYLERTMGNYEASLREYLHLIETAPRQHRLAQTKIMELLREQDNDNLIRILKRDADRPAPHRKLIFAVLAIAYLERGALENALEMALRADEPETSDGAVLLNLADRAVAEYESRASGGNARFFNLGLRATEAFLDRHASSPQVPRAKLMLVDLLVDAAAGTVDGPPVMPVETAMLRALNALDWVMTSYPGSEQAEQAYLKKGDAVLRLRKDPRAAIEIYKEGMAKARVYPSKFAERLGRAYLIVEEYDEARKHFERLVHSTTRELQEAGVFYSGLLLGFTREYEAARDTLTALAEGNPSSAYTNDAIEFAWVIEEGLHGDQRILHAYTSALEAEIASDTTAVVEQLAAIVALPTETPLRARALFKLGETYQGMKEYDAAVARYEAFVSEYPTSTLLPDARRRIAQIYEHGYGKATLALETYEDILITYPHYIFLDEVRKNVTRIRGLLRE